MDFPNCQTKNPESARYCMNCGAALFADCPNCGATLGEGAKFCNNCGRPLVKSQEHSTMFRLKKFMPPELAKKMESARASDLAEGERRIVTVLFNDVKGSTAIAEKLDPEDWAGIMNNAFERLISPVYRY